MAKADAVHSNDEARAGVVLAVGTTKALGNGGRHAMDVRLGDLVIYTKGKGKEVRVDNDEYLLLDRDE
ncbi:putative chaperonin (GroES/Cpn10) [Aspergillus novofumigatus IBT 16806]|uniref:Chaperonin n=1 Tax=Aspergillus novofumigatus (strain IBT 16806) TaxID=1392255 RepID=A0A2I1C0E5_ASPN1|nr:uncharacterized protein P174DRAFT_463243 [Aspergillus novofumigatus IBT 16806]PKX91098.1 hypothetical protein P174DRAFT_463243 [Aspergillus novofumigatus IBT 16806]